MNILEPLDHIGPVLGAVLITNNYFHDVATGLLLTSSVAIWIIMNRYHEGASPEVSRLLLDIYAVMSRVARYSLYYILVAGVPRTVFYTKLEWAQGVGDAQVPAIIVKHVLVFTAVGLGIYYWHGFNKKVKQIRAGLS